MEPIIIAIILILFLFFGLSRLFPSPEERGKQGERAVSHSLEKLAFSGFDGKILRNVYVPTSEDRSVEIDLLYITVKGIIVLESKNYAGYIFGNERNKNWTVTLYGGKDFFGFKHVDKFHFYNPIWQNKTHINCLQKYLEKDIRCLSVIVFSDRGEMKDVTWSSEDTIVCYSSDVKSNVRRYWESMPNCMTEEETERIYSLLYPLTIVSEEEKDKHIAQVTNKKYGRVTNGPETEDQDALKCPWCGGNLVMRTAKHGPTAGSQFYGCSNFPKCRYTRNIN